MELKNIIKETKYIFEDLKKVVVFLYNIARMKRLTK